MKHPFSIASSVIVCLWSTIAPANAQVDVTQFHNHASRDGLYVDSAFTLSAAANLTRDLNFDGTIVGNVYAQPLYIDTGPGGRPTIIAVTESNNVYALDALDGSIIWQRNDLGAPVLADDPCTIIDPLGITSTPIVDLASRALFLAAMITPDGGTTKKHLIFSLNVDTGDTNSGWPVDVEATASYNGINFTPESQLQRAALGIVGNALYVGYASHSDCSLYHGWLVGVPIDNPASVTAWAAATTAGTHGGAIWGVGGIASDGNNPFVTTGNTFGTNGNWDGGEAVIRFQPGPIFSGLPADYWVPTNWLDLDNLDVDLGASGPLLVDVPGATPSSLVVALGKDGNAYLLNRDNLGGITAPIASAQVAVYGALHQAAAAYRTNQGTYVALRADGSTLSAFRITGTNPPTIATGWTLSRDGCGSPFVTSTDGTSNVIVWVVGTGDLSGEGGDQRLHGYDGDTGAVVYAGGGANELMAGTYSYSTTGIAARGRIYVAGNNKVYAFAVPTPTPTPTPTPDACYPNFTTAEGCSTLNSLTTGAGNTALGWRSLFLDTTGSFNTGVGAGALILNNADSNTAVGAAAFLLNTTGTQNTAVGTDALVFNDSGGSNTATGYFALMNNTTGGSNTATGWESLIANTTGNNNTAIGNQALQSSETTSDHVAVGTMAGSGITTVDNNIIIGHHSGVHSVFGQVSDRCTIDNISGAPVSAATAVVVMVDSDGRLGTVTSDGPDPGGFSTKGIRPQAIHDAAKQAMLNLKVQNLRATVTQQQQQIETLTAQLKEQAAQIQKVNDQLEMHKSAPKVIANKP